MAQLPTSIRAQIAFQAQEVIDGRLKYWDFVDILPDGTNEDELLAELIDLIEHEPKVGGFLGTSAKEHEKYMMRVHEIIALLKETQVPSNPSFKRDALKRAP